MTVVLALFWVCVAIILYTFFGYPLLVGVLARYFERPVRKEDITPTVSLVIPAYNEASVIAQKIDNCLGLDYPPDLLEVVVITDGSDDETVDIVSSYGEAGVRLYHSPQRQGKAAAINRVVPLIDGEIVVFSDANTMIRPDALRALVRSFADPKVGGVSGEKRVEGGGEGLYWRYESFIKRCDSALRSVMGAAGEFFAVRKALFRPTEEDALIEDFLLSLRLVLDGHRVVYEAEAVALEEASPTLDGDWKRRTRIAAGGFQAIARLCGLLNPSLGMVAWQYVSHRVLRWAVTPFLLPLVLVLNGLLWEPSPYRALFLLQVAFYAAAFGGYVQTLRSESHGPLHTVFYFCFANAAAVWGFWRYITRTQPVTWEKAR